MALCNNVFFIITLLGFVVSILAQYEIKYQLLQRAQCSRGEDVVKSADCEATRIVIHGCRNNATSKAECYVRENDKLQIFGTLKPSNGIKEPIIVGEMKSGSNTLELPIENYFEYCELKAQKYTAMWIEYEIGNNFASQLTSGEKYLDIFLRDNVDKKNHCCVSIKFKAATCRNSG